jgi:septal ring factor EnvC (AmiA/AmiB activator)
MDFKNILNGDQGDTKKKRKTAEIILALGLLLVLVLWWFNTNSYSSDLKKAIKANKTKIDSIQKTKAPLLDSIEKIKIKLNENEDYINKLEDQEKALNIKLKYSKNENNRLKSSYLNSNVSQRVRLWSELTNEKDSAASPGY